MDYAWLPYIIQSLSNRKACAIPPRPKEPSVDGPFTPADQPDAFTGALSSKFGLPEAALKAFPPKAVAQAQHSSNLPKDMPAKYKPLKGVAKEEASLLIDQVLTNLLQLSQKHGTQSHSYNKLFQKKLSGSLWDIWGCTMLFKRATKGWDKNNNSEEEEAGLMELEVMMRQQGLMGRAHKVLLLLKQLLSI